MILCDMCSTSYDLAGITFSWHAQYFRQVEWKNRNTNWYQNVCSALNFPFLQEVSQNCFVFDVVKFKSGGSLTEFLRSDVVHFKDKGSLAELLRFQACRQTESQADRWRDRQKGRWTGRYGQIDGSEDR